MKITSLKRRDPTIAHDVHLATAPCSLYYDALWPCTWEVYEAAHTRPPVQEIAYAVLARVCWLPLSL